MWILVWYELIGLGIDVVNGVLVRNVWMKRINLE